MSHRRTGHWDPHYSNIVASRAYSAMNQPNNPSDSTNSRICRLRLYLNLTTRRYKLLLSILLHFWTLLLLGPSFRERNAIFALRVALYRQSPPRDTPITKKHHELAKLTSHIHASFSWPSRRRISYQLTNPLKIPSGTIKFILEIREFHGFLVTTIIFLFLTLIITKKSILQSKSMQKFDHF